VGIRLELILKLEEALLEGDADLIEELLRQAVQTHREACSKGGEWCAWSGGWLCWGVGAQRGMGGGSAAVLGVPAWQGSARSAECVCVVRGSL
jgi:hypothetical protein